MFGLISVMVTSSHSRMSFLPLFLHAMNALVKSSTFSGKTSIVSVNAGTSALVLPVFSLRSESTTPTRTVWNWVPSSRVLAFGAALMYRFCFAVMATSKLSCQGNYFNRSTVSHFNRFRDSSPSCGGFYLHWICKPGPKPGSCVLALRLIHQPG